jgi:hypothetical protein
MSGYRRVTARLGAASRRSGETFSVTFIGLVVAIISAIARRTGPLPAAVRGLAGAWLGFTRARSAASVWTS